jgi:hypothetical protein
VEAWVEWRRGSSGGVGRVEAWVEWRRGSSGGVGRVEEWGTYLTRKPSNVPSLFTLGSVASSLS